MIRIPKGQTIEADRAADIRAVLLVVLAVGQLVSPVFSQLLGGSFTTADRAGEPPIVPAGYTFSIWGLIEAVSLGWAIWAARRRRVADPLQRRVLDAVGSPLLVVFAGFSVWLVAAEVEPVWSTLVVFLVMGAGLLLALRAALRDRAVVRGWPRIGRALLWSTLGLYLGWSTVAIWLNLTTALAGSGAPIAGTAALVGQVGILAGATGTAVLLLRWTAGLLPYAAAVCWALAGAVVGALGAGETLLAGVAASGLAVVAVSTGVLRARRPLTSA